MGVPERRATVHTGSAGTMASSLMYSPEPAYPVAAIAAGVQGEVTVRAVVGPTGNVIDASVVSGPPLLREAALDAVGRWRYRPYEQDGKPVTIATTAILDFQIRDK
jgi:TonB family protein